MARATKPTPGPKRWLRRGAEGWVRAWVCRGTVRGGVVSTDGRRWQGSGRRRGRRHGRCNMPCL
jgi:hypothetical protein